VADASAVAVLEPTTGFLRSGLRRLRARIRVLLAVRVLSFGVALVGGGLALAVLWMRLNGLWYPTSLPAIGITSVALLSVIAALVWPLPDHRVAVSADRRLGLRDRISAAVQFLRKPERSGMERAAVADAAQTIRAVRTAEAYPIRLYPSLKVAAGCLVALLLFQLLPIPALLLADRDQEDRAELRKHARHIKPQAKALARAAREADDTQALELAKRLKKLADKLDRGAIAKKQAILSMKELEKELEKHAEHVAPKLGERAVKAGEKLAKKSRKTMAEKAEELAQMAAAKGDQKTAKEMRKLAEQLAKSAGGDELQKLASQLGKAAKSLGADMALPPEIAAALAKALAHKDLQEALQRLAEVLGRKGGELGELTEEQIEEMIKQLEALAEALKDADLDELAEALKDAAEALERGDMEAAQEALDRASKAFKNAEVQFRLAELCRQGGG